MQQVYKAQLFFFYKWEVYTHERSVCCNPT
jgi:hypothetical protein